MMVLYTHYLVIASGRRPRGNPGQFGTALDCFATLAMTNVKCVQHLTSCTIARSAAAKHSRTMRRDFQPAVYILASAPNGTLYVGVTSWLPKRVWEHRESVID